MNPPDALDSLANQQDPEMLLKLLDVEIANRRAKRLTTGAERQRMVRMLCVLALFGLILLLIGAFWYLQTTRPHRPINRPHSAASQVPATSAPAGR